jgi:hypothetical protein
MGSLPRAAPEWAELARLDSREAEAMLAPHAGRFATEHPEIGLEVDPLVFIHDGAALLAPGRYRDLVIPDRGRAICTSAPVMS